MSKITQPYLYAMLGSDWTTQMRLRVFTQNVKRKAYRLNLHVTPGETWRTPHVAPGLLVIIWVPLLSSWPISFCVHHGATKASSISMNNFPASTVISVLSYHPISGKTLCTDSDKTAKVIHVQIHF